MRQLEHLVQDLRANAHRVPEDIRPLIRQAAATLEQNLVTISCALDLAVLPAPFPPPAEQEPTTCA